MKRSLTSSPTDALEKNDLFLLLCTYFMSNICYIILYSPLIPLSYISRFLGWDSVFLLKLIFWGRKLINMVQNTEDSEKQWKLSFPSLPLYVSHLIISSKLALVTVSPEFPRVSSPTGIYVYIINVYICCFLHKWAYNTYIFLCFSFFPAYPTLHQTLKTVSNQIDWTSSFFLAAE